MFFAIEGRFLLEEHINLQRYSVYPSYTPEERERYTGNPTADFEYPENLTPRFKEINRKESTLARKARMRNDDTE